MSKLKKYNIQAEEVGEIQVADQLANAQADLQMVKDYLTAIRENARQWSANTKGRSEVKHTTAKPHAQKGSGRARQGSLVSPQFRGGGVVFGPKPKFNQRVRINQKERQAAIRFILGDRIRAGKLVVLDKTEMEAPKTKTVAQFLSQLQLTKKVLFLGETTYAEVAEGDEKKRIAVKGSQHGNFRRSLQNLKKTSFLLAQNVNAYDLMRAETVILTEQALQELTEWLCPEKTGKKDKS